MCPVAPSSGPSRARTTRWATSGSGTVPHRAQHAVVGEDGAVRAHQVEQLGVGDQGLEHRPVGGGDPADDPAEGGGARQLALVRVGTAALGDLLRGDLAQELGGRPGVLARPVRSGVVVAGDQPPQLPADDQRDRHRGGDAHVLEVLEVDGRDAAQRRERQVQRRPGPRVQHGVQRHRRVGDVGDEPGPVDRVEAPGLGGDVGGRVVQPEERVEVGAALLGDHLAVPVAVEPVDHHPVELGQLGDLVRQLGGEAEDRGLAGQPAHRGARGLVAEQHRARTAEGLDLDDQPVPGPVQADVDLLAGERAPARRQPDDQGLAERLLGRATAYQPGETLTHDVGERPADGPAVRDPGLLLAVLGRDRDVERLGVHGQQQPVRLDRPRDVDRLVLARRQVGGVVGRRVPGVGCCGHGPSLGAGPGGSATPGSCATLTCGRPTGLSPAGVVHRGCPLSNRLGPCSNRTSRLTSWTGPSWSAALSTTTESSPCATCSRSTVAT